MAALRRPPRVYLVATTAWHPGGVTHFAHGGRPGPILLTPGLSAELRRVGPFLCVGLVGFAVDAALFCLAHGVGLSRPLARAISLALATAVTFGLNRRFTFAAGTPGRIRCGPGAAAASPEWPLRLQAGGTAPSLEPERLRRSGTPSGGSGQFVRYGIVTLLVQGSSYGLFLLLATRIPNLVALFVGAAAATVFSFAGQRLFTFRGTAAPGPAQAGETALVSGLLRRRRARRRSSRP